MENLFYILLFILGLFIFLQILIRFLSIAKKGKKVEEIEGELGELIAGDKPQHVYFYSNSCSACKPMTPVIEQLLSEYKNLHKINIADDPDKARKFGVLGTPALVSVKNNRIVSYLLGAKNENMIRKVLSV